MGRISKGLWLVLVGLGGLLAFQEPATLAEKEQFLRRAKIVSTRVIPKGITVPKRATLEMAGFTHDAALQTVDISRLTFETDRGTELNFRDCWKFNVAGYELAKLLELDMVPPYVERRIGGQEGSFSWWVDNAMMEVDRRRQHLEPPDHDAWQKQMYAAKVFQELIYNTDANLTNMLVTQDWRVWLIDFSRAFRMMHTVREPKNLVRCDRRLLDHLRRLDRATLNASLSHWLTPLEIEGLAARAGKIVEFFDREVAAKGEAAVVY